MAPSKSTLQEFTTTLSVDDVITSAKAFFGKRSALYATFPDKQGPGYCTFRGQGGEEIAIAATSGAGGTRVTGSTYLFDMQVARFFASLPPAAAQA